MGIFGLLVFLLLIFFFAQKNFEFLKNNESSSLRNYVSAAFVAVVGVLVVGLFDYPWYNYRMYFLFFAVMAIAIACIRIGDREKQKQSMMNHSPDKASIDI